MGDEFYCSIKLVSGEEIFALISVDENDGDPIIILQNPVMIEMIESPVGIFVKINPWMKIPDDDLYMIKLDKVITMTEIKDKQTIQMYNRYLRDSNGKDDDSSDETGKVSISNKMGYITSVEEARKRLENLFK
jgi:hypothetical protein